ncbi:MAG: hypothetical protein LBK95_09385 [Bifidobacteriaceae bacterium]|jgi:hypothetical protein|nr:hypothetical protein [Bifidobacteriaceae bacterium]
MLTREAASEAWRSLTSGTSRWLGLALAGAAVMAGLVVADGRAMAAQIAAAREYDERGATTWVAKAPGRIDGAVCEALAGLPNVRAAGALAPDPKGLTTGQLPSNPVTAYRVSPAFPGLLAGNVAMGGVGLVASDQVMSTLGLEVGERLWTRAGSAAVAGAYAYPDDGRRTGMGWAVLQPSPSNEVFDECWARIEPSSQGAAQLLRTAARPSSGEDKSVEVAQLNTALGPPVDTVATFAGRPTGRLWVVAAAATSLMAAIWVRSRRLELASARHAGVPRSAAMAQIGLEALAWLLLAAVVSLPVVAAYATASDMDDAASLAWTLARVPLAGLAAGLLSAMATAGLVRPRRLFTYFKVR